MVRNFLLILGFSLFVAASIAQPVVTSARTTSTTNVEVDWSETLTILNGGATGITITGLTVTGAAIVGDKLNLTITPPISSVNFNCASPCLSIPNGKVESAGGASAPETAGVLDGIFPTQPAAPTAAAGPLINASEGAGFPVRASIAGTGALAGDVVSLLLGGAPFGTPQNHTLVAGDITNGYFDFTMTTALLGADGAKVITSRVTDVNSNVGPESPALNLTLDTNPPGISIGAPSATLANNGSIITYTITYTGADAVTLANGNVSINQTGGAGADVNVSGAGTATRTVTLDNFTGNGTVGISIVAGTASDNAGNTAPAAGPSATITVDNLAPTAPPAPTAAAGPLINATENGAFSVVVGALGATGAVAGDVLELLINGASFAVPRTQTLTGGQVTSGFTFTNVILPAPDGVYNLTARVTDQIGNVGAESPQLALTRDVTAPTAPSTPTAAAGPLINAAENGAFSIVVPGIDGTGAVVGDVLELLVGGVSFAPPRTQTLVIGDITPAGYTFTNVTLPSPDGVKNITARVTDQAGNAGAQSAQLALTRDVTPPTVTVGAPSLSITNTGPVDFLVTYSGATSVNLLVANVTLNTTSTATGTISVLNGTTTTPTVRISGITGDGTIGITIAANTSSDAAGNTNLASAPSSTFTVDNTPPAAPGTPNLTAGTDSFGVANGRVGTNSDDITNSTNPTFTGSGVNGNDVIIFSSISGQLTTGAVSSSSYSISVGAIVEGVHTITARQRDAAGNLSVPSAGLAVTIDRTPPAISGTPVFAANGGGRETVTISFTENVDMGDGLVPAHNSSTEPNRDGWYPSQGNIRNSGSSFINGTPDKIVLQSVDNNEWSSATTFRYNNTSLHPTNAADQHPNYIHDIAGNEMATVLFSLTDNEPPVLISGFVLNPNGNSPETIVFQVNETLTSPNPITGFSVNGVPTNGVYNAGANNTITLTSPLNGTWDNSAMVSYSAGNVTDGINPMVAIPNTPIRLQNIIISSNNTNGFTQRAKPLDVVTVNFVTSVAPTVPPTVILDNDTGTPAVVTGAHPNYQATYTITGANNDGVLPLLVYMLTAADSTGTNSTTLPLPVESSITVDKTPPVISPVSIASDFSNPAFASPGNTVTLSFTVNEPLFTTPAVTIDGKVATVVSTHPTYTASVLTDATYNEGVLAFSITVQDEVGNVTIRTTTSDATSVTFDKTPPTVQSIAISSTLNGIGTTNGYTPPPNSVNFLVTFNDPNTVSGVDAGDFQIISDPTVIRDPNVSFTPLGSNQWTISVTNVSGSGRVRINVIDNNTIIDQAGNPLGGPALGDGNFITSFTGSQYYTIALPAPSNPILNPTVNKSGTNFTVSWNDAIAPAQQATHYLVMIKRTTTPNFVPNPAVDGSFVFDDPNDLTLPNGTFVRNISFGTNTAVFSGLSVLDNFDAIIYPYTLGPNNTIDNINFGTSTSVYSTSDIVRNTGFTYPTNIAYHTHQATDILNSGTSIVLEEFNVRDGAGASDPDALPTILTGITLEVTNYQNNLRRLALYNGGTEVLELDASLITNTGPSTGEITFSGFTFSAADNTNQTLSIRASFLGNGVIDNQVITFRVVNVTSAATGSSQFLTTTPAGIQSSVTGDQNRIEVTATDLDYVNIPPGGTSAFISANFNVIVHARDGFDNLDIDFAGNVSSITNAGSLLTSPSPATSGVFTAGVKDFTFQYLTAGNGTLTMSTTGPSISGQVSPPISVVASSESRMYLSSTYSPTIDYINHQQASNPNTFTLATVNLSDGDADGFPGDPDNAATVLTDFTVSITNPTFIKRIALYNSAGTLIGGTDQAGGATVNFTGLSITAPDDGSTFFTIRASFENTTVIDEQNIQLTVTAATEGVGSNFQTGAGLIGGVDITQRQTPATGANIIDVLATRLDFTTQPDAISGVGEPFTDFPPIPVVQARDVHQRLDLGHDFNATLGTGGATLDQNTFPFIDGLLVLGSVEYSSTGNGTLVVNSNGLSSTSGGSIACTNVDVLDVSAALATGGVVGSTNLAGGAVDRVIFGVTFTAPYQVGGAPDLNSFKISFGNPGATNPINGIFTNFRVFRNSSPSFGGPNVTTFGATVTPDANGSDLNIVFSTPEDLSTPKSYFLMVDVVSTASGSTPAVTPSVVDAGYASATAGNIVTTQGSATANVLGQNYNFSAIFPPTLTNSYPASGQLNVSPDQPELRLTFSVPVWSLDQKVTLHDQTAGTSIDLVATNGLLGVDGGGTPDPTTLDNPLIFVHPVNPTLSLIPDHLYYVTISDGLYNGPFDPMNRGVMDEAGNLFAGITYQGTLYFKAASLYPPNLLSTPVASVNPAISNVTISGATISGTFDKTGKAYFLVLPNGTPAPTPAQVREDAIHPSRLAQGSFEINQTISISQSGNIIPLSGSFNAGTTYDVWVSAESYSELNSVLTPIPATPPSPFGNAATVVKTGTITSSASTTTVTGAGTFFTSELVPGRTLFDNTGTQIVGTIATIESDNSLTLVNNAVNVLTNEPFRASGFEIGGTGPTLQFTPPSPSANLTVNNPSITVCTGSFQILPDPIVITESVSRNEFSGTLGTDQIFNLVLPAGFIFDVTLDGTQPLYGNLSLNGSDFTSGGNGNLSFIGNSILRISFRNNGSASLDNIIISGLRVLATSPTSGTIRRFAGDAIVPELAELGDVATLTAINAAGIGFTNSYTQQTFGNNAVTTIPNNFNDPNLNQPLTTELIPLPPFGDFGPSTFSGPGVNINLLNLTAVTLNAPFNITINHTDNNGCPSQSFEQYTVYNAATAIADLSTEYCAVNSNFTIADPTALSPTGVNTHIVTYNRLQAYYLDDLSADVPQFATSIEDGTPLASDQIIFGPGWQNVLENFLISQIGSGFDPPNNPRPGHDYFNYEFDEATILNARSIDPTIPRNPYDYFIATSSQGNTYYTGGSLGIVQFTGLFQSIANANIIIPLLQNVRFFVPPVPIVEFELTNSSTDLSDPLNPVEIFCDGNGEISINGFPAASAGASVGRFRLYDNLTNNPIYDGTPIAGFIDNTNGTATLDPSILINGYQTIRVEYTYKDDVSPCEATATKLLRISPSPVADFTTTNECEDGTGTQFTDLSSVVAPGVIDRWNWNFADANSSSNTSNLQNPIHIYADAGSYLGVDLGVQTVDNCQSVVPASKDILIGSTPIVGFTFAGVSTAEPMQFNSTTNIVVDNPVQYNLLWDFGDGNQISSTNNGATFENQYTNPGIYPVTLTVTSGKGCVDDLTKNIVMVNKVTPTDAVAYAEDFESDDGGWQVTADPTFTGTVTWQHGTPTTSVITVSPINGSNVWATNLSGPYSPREESYLYTPCFDMTQLLRPMISFNAIVQTETGDGIVLEYSLDNKNIADPTKVWTLLPNPYSLGQPSGVDWYNAQSLPSKPGNQVTGDFGWSGTVNTKWQEPKHILDDVAGQPNAVFRIALASVSTTPATDGFAIDNVRIGNRTRTILLENFTNKGNLRAVGGEIIEKRESDLLKSFNPLGVGTQIVKINYHVGFPTLDPFNLDNPADPSSRALYYNITETPIARLDGEKNPGNADEFFSQWGEVRYGIRTLQLAQADLSLTATSLIDGGLQVDVQVIPKVDLPAKTRLHVAILEEEVSIGSLSTEKAGMIATGETEFDGVLKKMLPSALGTRFDTPLPAGQIRNFGPFIWYPEETKLYAPANDIAVAVFLQDEDTKEVFQTEMVSNISDPPVVTGINKDELLEQVAVFPNPADYEITVMLPAPAASRIRLQIASQLGVITNDMAFEVGQQSKTIDTKDLAAGIYFLQLGDGKATTRKKVMIVHR